MTTVPVTAVATHAGDDSRCGRCGYSIWGLPGFTCPECGDDLREVGIVVPRRTARQVKRLIAAIPFRAIARVSSFLLIAAVLFAAPAVLLACLLTRWIVWHDQTDVLRLYGKVDITFTATGGGFVVPAPRNHLRIDYTAADAGAGSAEVDAATLIADLTDPSGSQHVTLDPDTLFTWKCAIDRGDLYTTNRATVQQMYQIVRSARSSDIAEYKDNQWDHVYGRTSQVALVPPWLPLLATGLWLPVWVLLISRRGFPGISSVRLALSKR